MMKRIISCLLVCFLLLGLCPAALAAAGSPTATAAVTANAQGSATVVLTVKAGSGSSHGRVTATMPAGGTRKLGAAPLRMGKAPKFVIASLAEQGAAISQYRPEHGKAPAKSKVPT